MNNYVGNKYKLALRGLIFYLLYGGVINVIGVIVGFCLRLTVDYSFYKEEAIWIFINLAEWIAFVFTFGLKYVENIGYIDDYDHVYCYKTYFRHMSLVTLFVFIPVILSMGGIGAAFAYIIGLCYEPSLLIAHFINNDVYSGLWYYKAETMHYGPQFVGLLIMLPINLIVFMPFYALGKHNRREDLKNGYKLRIKS